MITMKSLKRGAIALLLVATFIAAGVFEAAAVPALLGTYGKGEYTSSTLVEINPTTGGIIRIIGQVGHGINGLAWDPTTQTLYGSARESNRNSLESGNHDGDSGSPILVDSGENFIADGIMVGMQVENHTDNSWGTITAVSATTITASLMGGSENDWDNGDSYTVYKLTFNGLVQIDLATGEGTPVGVQGWGLGPTAVVTNIAVNVFGHMYGWTEDGDDLVRINKATGVATVVGDSGISTYANSLAFDNFAILYMINGDGRYYDMNPDTGQAFLMGDFEPGVELPLHHGVFEPDTNIFYGLRNNPWPWEDSTTNLLTANLTSGLVTSTAPTAYDLHTLAFVDLPCVLELNLTYDSVNDELEAAFKVGTEEQAVLSVWLHVYHQEYFLGAAAVPVTDPREPFDASIPFPDVGNVGILATLSVPGEGIACSVWKTVDTGR